MKPMSCAFAALLFSIFVPVAAQAEPAVMAPGTLWAPVGDLPLRDAPPSAFLGLKGELVGTAEVSQPYLLLEQRVNRSLFGDDLWVRVRPWAAEGQDPPVGTCAAEGCWIYAGPEGRPANLMPVEREP